MNMPTPGPWRVLDNELYVELPDHGLRHLATIHHPADILLIAAAPDLLQALKGLLDPYHLCDLDCKTRGCPRETAAKVAVRKALGIELPAD